MLKMVSIEDGSRGVANVFLPIFPMSGRRDELSTPAGSQERTAYINSVDSDNAVQIGVGLPEVAMGLGILVAGQPWGAAIVLHGLSHFAKVYVNTKLRSSVE